MLAYGVMMKKKIVPIRDIEIIEKELKDHKLGVIAYTDSNDKINQAVSSYIYSDKNIYIFFEEKEDARETIISDRTVSFTIFKKEEAKKQEKAAPNSIKFFQIKCSGKIKKIEDSKIVEEVQKNHSTKYAIPDQKPSVDEQLYIIDTDEIQAVEIYE